MYVWRGTCTVDGDVADDGDVRECAGGDDYGYTEIADDVWDVLVDGESDGGVGDSGGDGGADAHAVYSQLRGTLGAGVGHRHDRGKARTE